MKKPKKKQSVKPSKPSKPTQTTKSPKAANAKPRVVPALDATPIEEVRAIASKAKASIAYVRGLFPKLATLSADERSQTGGRLSEDEEAAARAVLNGKRASGDSPELRERLERRAALVDVASSLGKLFEEVSDTAILFEELVRPALRSASESAAE